MTITKDSKRLPFAVHLDHIAPLTETSFQQKSNVFRVLISNKIYKSAFVLIDLYAKLLLLLLPDLLLLVNELNNNGKLLIKDVEVNVSADSQARDMFNSIIPISCPH